MVLYQCPEALSAQKRFPRFLSDRKTRIFWNQSPNYFVCGLRISKSTSVVFLDIPHPLYGRFFQIRKASGRFFAYCGCNLLFVTPNEASMFSKLINQNSRGSA